MQEKEAVRQYLQGRIAAGNIGIDWVTLFLDSVSLVGDIAVDNVGFFILDAVSFIAHGLHLLRDIELSKGGTLPSWITGITTIFEVLAGVANTIKAIAQFGFGLGPLMKEFSQGVTKGIAYLGANMGVSIANAGISFVTGANDYYSQDLADLDTGTPSWIHERCTSFGLAICK
ncbi:hypothetical protein KDK_69760 [Dictyobacter kobayashii]|uniref:Uncharacterized protein n=2 Tax=Dictyobacter kobayashii TaxID=2014872 RepID=A0A402AVN7_9CHLR|nr:hypothetical protein KDK_69760 [Dictyobacter kobayashii]